MYITLDQFESDVSKYLKLAMVINIYVVDMEKGRCWTISRGNFLDTKPIWGDLLEGMRKRGKAPATVGVYA